MAEKKAKGRGAPTSYDPKTHPAWAASLARLGATNAEIAGAMGIGQSTLYSWQSAHPEFMESLKAAKAVADARVEDSLYARATGTSKRTTKRKREVLDSAGRKVTLSEVVEETPAPDVTACIFWLKNRQPELWRDHPEANAKAATDDAIKAAIAKAGLR